VIADAETFPCGFLAGPLTLGLWLSASIACQFAAFAHQLDLSGTANAYRRAPASLLASTIVVISDPEVCRSTSRSTIASDNRLLVCGIWSAESFILVPN
jgi:hypothetical protein